jgi:hypothetical protein
MTPEKYLLRRASVNKVKKKSSRLSAPTGADFLARLELLDLPAGYGDPNIDAVELARRIREDAENNRPWNQRQ